MNVKADMVMAHDMTAGVAIDSFREIGAQKVDIIAMDTNFGCGSSREHAPSENHH